MLHPHLKLNRLQTITMSVNICQHTLQHQWFPLQGHGATHSFGGAQVSGYDHDDFRHSNQVNGTSKPRSLSALVPPGAIQPPQQSFWCELGSSMDMYQVINTFQLVSLINDDILIFAPYAHYGALFTQPSLNTVIRELLKPFTIHLPEAIWKCIHLRTLFLEIPVTPRWWSPSSPRCRPGKQQRLR